MTLASIKSPCVKVCAVDGETGWCLGCGRSLPEIAGWAGMTPAGREAVMADLDRRLERLAPKRTPRNTASGGEP